MKSILITGASSGIGRATALRLATKGWRVFAAVRKDDDARRIQSDSGGHLETVFIDVTDRESIARAAREIDSRLNGQGLDGLFNNAGIGMISPIEYLSLDELRRIYEINLFGQIATIQAFLPLIRAAKGRIINSGSIGDRMALPFGGALASTKAAFASMSGALRLELRPQGIAVCLLEPASIRTPAVEKVLGTADRALADLPPAGMKLYGDAMRHMTRAIAKSEMAGSPPEVVAATVERALTDRHPRTRYRTGKDSTKFTLLSFLPEKLVDFAVLKTIG